MAIEKEPNSSNNYNVSVGGFKGLFTSLNAALIPDGYLAAMSNVKIDNFGVAHSVYAPMQETIATPFPAGGITHISQPFIKYVQIGTEIYTEDGQKLSDIGSNQYPIKVINYIDSLYFADHEAGLHAADGVIAEANAGFGDVFYCRDICVYKNRLYFAINRTIRFSHPADASLATTWNGDNFNNFIDMKDGGQVIEFAPTGSGLVIFTYGKAFLLTEPKSGSIGEIYSGQYGPQMFMYNQHNYCDGSALYYACWDGFYQFSPTNGLKKLSDQLNLAIYGCHVGNYDGRLWFLAFPNVVPTTGVPVLYALNMTTGAWEQYDSGPARQWTALCGGGDSIYTDSGELSLGASDSTLWSWGRASTQANIMPWTFTTKNFTPSLDCYSRPRSVKLTYAGQAVSSVATVQLYTDGVLKDTVTFDMVGSGLYHVEKQVVADNGNSLQLVVSGTGPMEILDCAIEFIPRHKGDANV